MFNLRCRNLYSQGGIIFEYLLMNSQFSSYFFILGLLSQRQTDIIVMGATNRPQDVDKAILRRMPCRFYVPMPDKGQRLAILQLILDGEKLDDEVDIEELAELSDSCSGSDLKEFCRLAALSCIRDASSNINDKLASDQSLPEIRAINMDDFKDSLKRMQNNHAMLTSHGFYAMN
eukprot:Seg1067.1 transcript_id=Seg1067.1/GoldUCD/mRNA.D3Y31 product="ATPase family AAA domain-containing protein 1" protein_id=Seg1067.1/GoldUCD/D3Y31